MATGHRETVLEKLQVKNNGGPIKINLVVRQTSDVQSGMSGLRTVTFEEISSPGETWPGKAVRQGKKKKSEDVSKLEEELQYTKENLQPAIEELKSTNEELQSTNEEL
jgi:two-component system CheB/CheR fusion protein